MTSETPENRNQKQCFCPLSCRYQIFCLSNGKLTMIPSTILAWYTLMGMISGLIVFFQKIWHLLEPKLIIKGKMTSGNLAALQEKKSREPFLFYCLFLTSFKQVPKLSFQLKNKTWVATKWFWFSLRFVADSKTFPECEVCVGESCCAGSYWQEQKEVSLLWEKMCNHSSHSDSFPMFPCINFWKNEERISS